MTTSDEQTIPQSKKIMLWLFTLVLWLATAGIGVLAFIAFQDIATTAVAFALTGSTDIGTVEMRGWITTTRNVSAMLGGLLWLAMVVGGVEYHFRHVGQRRSYRVFAWTLGIEVMLIALSVFLF